MINYLKIFLILFLTSCISDRKEKLFEEFKKSRKEYIHSLHRFGYSLHYFKSLPEFRVRDLRIRQLQTIAKSKPSSKKELDSYISLSEILVDISDCFDRFQKSKTKKNGIILSKYIDKMKDRINKISKDLSPKDSSLLQYTKNLYGFLKDTSDKRDKMVHAGLESTLEKRSNLRNRPNESPKLGKLYIISR